MKNGINLIGNIYPHTIYTQLSKICYFHFSGYIIAQYSRKFWDKKSSTWSIDLRKLMSRSILSFNTTTGLKGFAQLNMLRKLCVRAIQIVEINTSLKDFYAWLLVEFLKKSTNFLIILFEIWNSMMLFWNSKYSQNYLIIAFYLETKIQ